MPDGNGEWDKAMNGEGRGGVKENIHVIPSPSRWGRDGAEAAKVVCCRAETGGAVGERKIDLQLTSLLP